MKITVRPASRTASVGAKRVIGRSLGAPSTTKTEIAVRGYRTAAESTRHSGGSDEHDSEEEPAEEGTHRKSSQTQSGPVHCTRAKGSGERRAWCCSLSSSRIDSKLRLPGAGS